MVFVVGVQPTQGSGKGVKRVLVSEGEQNSRKGGCVFASGEALCLVHSKYTG